VLGCCDMHSAISKSGEGLWIRGSPFEALNKSAGVMCDVQTMWIPLGNEICYRYDPGMGGT
jgi:hypothetical protein